MGTIIGARDASASRAPSTFFLYVFFSLFSYLFLNLLKVFLGLRILHHYYQQPPTTITTTDDDKRERGTEQGQGLSMLSFFYSFLLY
jgi:hypothetical protein